MKKNVIGLRLEYLLPALIASAVCAATIFLPYASAEGESLTLLNLASAGWLHMVAAVCAIAAALLGIFSYFSPNVKTARIWVAIAAVCAGAYVAALFANKSVIDGLSLLPVPFLVTNLGLGCWLGLCAAFVSLVLAMKTAKINTGYIVLVILSVIWLFPILWIVLTSLREE